MYTYNIIYIYTIYIYNIYIYIYIIECVYIYIIECVYIYIIFIIYEYYVYLNIIFEFDIRNIDGSGRFLHVILTHKQLPQARR